MLQIVGLGAGDLNLLTLEAYQALEDVEEIYLRTEKHPAVNDLRKKGIEFKSFDYLYESSDSFIEVYQKIVDKVVNLVKNKENIIYAVPGHPLVAEDTVQEIINRLSDRDYKIIAGPSFLDAIFATLGLDPIAGVKIIDGLNFTSRDLDPSIETIISQVYNRSVASEIKLNLMEVYPDEFEVKVLRGVGLENERIEQIPLYELDRLDWIDHLTTLYLPPDKNNTTQFKRLLEIMELLRSPQGCPWDLKQDHQSLRKHLIEEAYEVLERIEKEDFFGLADELGDLLLQVVFHAQIAKEEGTFTIYNVLSQIIEKMVRRHPHIFGEVEVANEDEVMKNWEEIKKKEKGGEGSDSILDAIPNQLPALMQAQKIQAKAAKVGFDWPKINGALAKVEEELIEFKEALNTNDSDNKKEEFGDLIFALVNVARFLDIDAELALRETILKFKKRFNYIERSVTKNNQELQALSLAQLDQLWEEAKRQ